MDKIFFLAFFLLTTVIKINAQNGHSYIKFTPAEITTAKKVSKDKATIEIDFSFNKGVEYQGNKFWFITTKNDEKYYFKSTKTFTELVFIKEDFSSLMEYIIEESDF